VIQGIGGYNKFEEIFDIEFDIYLADSKIVPVGYLYTSYVRRVVLKRLLSRENLYALILCLIVIVIIIVTTDQAPTWIYQGF
jgi:hypothetical protein